MRAAADDAEVRVVVLTGTGKSFCAGADLNWMREIIAASYEQNLRRIPRVAEFHEELYSLPKPTIARVNGTAIGGGAGFLSACDIVVASSEAKFGLERGQDRPRPGRDLAVCRPPHRRKPGAALFPDGGADRRPAGAGDRPGQHRRPAGGARRRRSTRSSPAPFVRARGAGQGCKELLRRVPGMRFEEAKAFTAEMIAGLRVSREGQEGMAAFLEKTEAGVGGLTCSTRS